MKLGPRKTLFAFSQLNELIIRTVTAVKRTYTRANENLKSTESGSSTLIFGKVDSPFNCNWERRGNVL